MYQQISDQRQVIGGQPGELQPRGHQIEQFQITFDVEPVQGSDWRVGWKGPYCPLTPLKTGRVQNESAQNTPDIVQIACNNERYTLTDSSDRSTVQQPFQLHTPFYPGKPEVHVKQMDCARTRSALFPAVYGHANAYMQHAASLLRADSEIDIF